MPLFGLREIFRLAHAEADLYGIVAVRVFRLHLCYHIRRNREERDRHRSPPLVPNLGHIYFYSIFTSIFTPDGSDRLVSASTSLPDGFTMSTRRLCARISNCSRAFLCTNAPRFTVYLRISVGSGTGPCTVASNRAAVSIIWRTDASRILCSYARTRMRSFATSVFFTVVFFTVGAFFGAVALFFFVVDLVTIRMNIPIYECYK